MSELSSSASAAGTRENILVVANNSNSQALLAAAAAAVAISPITGNAAAQSANNTSSSNASNSLQQVQHLRQQQHQQGAKGSNHNPNRLTPNSAMYSLPPMTISGSSSRSSLCTPRSSTSLLSTTDIDNLLIDMHGLNANSAHQHFMHQQHLNPSQNHGHLNFGQLQSSAHHLPVIGSPSSFLTADAHRHSLHLGTSNIHHGPSSILDQGASSLTDSNGNILGHLMTTPNFSNSRLFLDVANNNNNNNSNSVVKMRNKVVSGSNNGAASSSSAAVAGAASAQQQQQHNKLMAFLNSESGVSSMLPSSSSSSSLLAATGSSGAYSLAQTQSMLQQQQSNGAPQPGQHHSYSCSASNVQPLQNLMTRNLNSKQTAYNSLGMPSSASSISSNSSSQFCPQQHQQQQHFLSSVSNNASVPLLLSDYDDYAASTTKLASSSARNSGLNIAGSQGVNAAVANALISQYRQSTASNSGLNTNKIYGSLGNSTDARNEFESLYRKYVFEIF